MNYITWAKSNRKELVAQVVGDQRPPAQDKPIAVFMAGVPGAGKTEFLRRLFGDHPDAVKIDLDEIVKLFPDYVPDRYYEYREAGFIILDECVIYCRKRKLNFILDGTFGYSKAAKNIESALKRHDVVIVYIWKDPSQAWQHTKDRKIVEGRPVDRDGFIAACEHVPENIQKVRSRFGDQVEVIAVKKNKTDDNFQMMQHSEGIDQLLQVRYTRSELEKIIL